MVVNTAQKATILYNIVLRCTALYCTALYCIVLYCTECTELYCNVIYCTVLHCTIPYCTVLSFYLFRYGAALAGVGQGVGGGGDPPPKKKKNPLPKTVLYVCIGIEHRTGGIKGPYAEVRMSCAVVTQNSCQRIFWNIPEHFGSKVILL